MGSKFYFVAVFGGGGEPGVEPGVAIVVADEVVVGGDFVVLDAFVIVEVGCYFVVGVVGLIEDCLALVLEGYGIKF